jgi:hypothetical protein
MITLALLLPTLVRADNAAPREQTFQAPHGQAVSVEMIGPVTQSTDLQVICILRHDPAGDKFIAAMADLDQKLHGLISSLRDRGEFVGEPGETLLFNPPANSIGPKEVLLIGVGDEAGLTLEKLALAGRIAAREAVRLKASQVSFASTLRDQGSTRIDVAEGDAAVAQAWILAYDTEKKLQEQGLAPTTDVTAFTIEAGPSYFVNAAAKVGDAVKSAAAAIQERTRRMSLNEGGNPSRRS